MIFTTGVGSLPHTDIQDAIEYSLKFDIPFYPQLPLKSIEHSMVYEGLDGFNGFNIDSDFKISIRNRNAKLDSYKIPENLVTFVDTLNDKNIQQAKFQIIGFHTLKKVLMNSSIDLEFIEEEILPFYIQKLVIINSYLDSQETNFLIFVDEPSLSQNSTEIEKELNFYEGVSFIDGIHCCAKINLEALLKGAFKYVSIDMFLYIDEIGKYKKTLNNFKKSGGKIVWGIVDSCHEKKTIPVDRVVAPINDQPIIISPSCGLAMSTLADCDKTLEQFCMLRDQRKN